MPNSIAKFVNPKIDNLIWFEMSASLTCQNDCIFFHLNSFINSVYVLVRTVATQPTTCVWRETLFIWAADNKPHESRYYSNGVLFSYEYGTWNLIKCCFGSVFDCNYVVTTIDYVEWTVETCVFVCAT